MDGEIDVMSVVKYIAIALVVMIILIFIMKKGVSNPLRGLIAGIEGIMV